MKTTIFLVALMTIFSLTTIAQKEKEKQETKKELKSDIKEKATRTANKEAKRLTKEGYLVVAGALPMAKQLDDAWMKQYEQDELGYPKWIVAQGKVVGENYEASKTGAMEIAKMELAGLIATQVAALTEVSVANQDLSKEDAASVTKTVTAAKNLIAQQLGRVIVILEIYKVLDNKNQEVQVRLAYNVKLAMEAAKNIIRKKLEDETQIAHEKLEKLMGMDKLNDVKKNSNVPEEQ